MPLCHIFQNIFMLHIPAMEINIYWLYIVICKTHNCVQQKHRNRVCGNSKGGWREGGGRRVLWPAEAPRCESFIPLSHFYCSSFLLFHSPATSTLACLFFTPFCIISLNFANLSFFMIFLGVHSSTSHSFPLNCPYINFFSLS